MTGVSKHFNEVQALDKVDLHVENGTIHALVGENGAGKTTLMRILFGAIQADSGSIEINGVVTRLADSKQAIQAGIGMVSQHYGIIPELSCLQNLILGAEGGPFLRGTLVARAKELAGQTGFAFDWNAPAESLSPSGAQKLEILKLLWRNAAVMILDEPTAMLSPADSEALFQSLHGLASQGATVILVTHRLPEVLDHCTRVTVLRGGRRVGEMPVAATDQRELANLIVGGSVAEPSPRGGTLGADMLSVTGLGAGSRSGKKLKFADLSVKSGEIVGIAGVDGSGQRELFQAIAGISKSDEGTVTLRGEEITRRTAAERIESGIRLIPEDRNQEGLVMDWSLEENAALGLQRLPPFAKGRAIDVAGRRRASLSIADRFDTKHSGLSSPAGSLSGGNQQRFVAGRALSVDPKLILAFHPSRGLDISGTIQLYEGIRQVCARGAGALVVSFDLDELLEHCDRVLAMYQGQLIEPPAGKGLDRETIGHLMVGAR